MKSKPSQIIITIIGERQDVWQWTKDLNCGLTFLLQWEQFITLSSLDTMFLVKKNMYGGCFMEISSKLKYSNLAKSFLRWRKF